MISKDRIEISLEHFKSGLILYIYSRQPNTLFDAEESALANNEARYQLVEGCFYDYDFNDEDIRFESVGEQIIQAHPTKKNIGSLSPNIFVGTLPIPIIKKQEQEKLGYIEFEVQSIKSGYRDDYRDMLELITEKCTDLLLQSNSPVSHHFEIDYTKDNQILYQKFAFIKSVIGSEEFAESVHRIVTNPVTKWSEITQSRDIRQARRFSNTNIKEFQKGTNRSKLPEAHYLRTYGLETLPERINSIYKTDSVDTPENRFVKHALETFLKFCSDINSLAKAGSKLHKESSLLIRELESQLHHSIFKGISRPTTLKLNSPILQRKEGYREILRVWLMFDLAAKLIWTGGDDIYRGGKKDIATLYEYWLFFKLLDLFQSIFKIRAKDIKKLIKKTNNGLDLQLKQGKFTALRGIYDSLSRKLEIRFSYNRSFSGKREYPNSGSWTTTLRPDYTLSFWPFGVTEEEAEEQELIVHIHFDAKYKIANFKDFIDHNSDNELDQEKIDNRKGVYKNADLLKMHAYKDAIRRTGGAYVLYPGHEPIKRKGFHEIIPGLGAFPVQPSKLDNGMVELKNFILEVVNHFINRSSQREKIGYRTFDIFKTPPDSDNVLNKPLPETLNQNRGLIPDDTYVLVGFYKNKGHYDWIRKNKLYNFRTGTGKGSLILDKETVNAKYLLLHTKDETNSSDLWEIVSKGPKVLSKKTLIKKGYDSPSEAYYLVIEIKEVELSDFGNNIWDFKKLKNYQERRNSALPFTATLTELMNNIV